MAAHYIEETEAIQVKSLAVLLYGAPGISKTSIGNTADDPLCLDFDEGAHRSFNRKPTMRFDSWPDVEAAWEKINGRKTVVVDTIGRALDMLSLTLVAENSKWGTRAGGLTIQGYGALGSRFAMWNNLLRAEGKDRVYLAHEKEEKDGDDRYWRPEIVGKSYTEAMKCSDIVGYIFRDRQNKRWIDFNPTDRHLGKNPAAWPIVAVPELADARQFLAGLLVDAKAKIGQISAEGAAIVALVSEWQKKLDADPPVPELTAMILDLPNQPQPAYAQLRQIMKLHCDKAELAWNKETKTLTPKVTEAA
jgi:hypothetical protein